MPDKQVTFGPGLDGIISGAGGKRGPVIITHGAGRGMDATLLVKTAERLSEAGFVVLRFNFGYLGKRPAPSQGGKNERPELVAAIDYMKQHGSPVLIGKSFGARVSSHVASERDDIRALVFYGLPLQGMSKTSKPRDWSHLAKIKAPILFITGNKDSLCPLPELNKVLPLVGSSCESHVVAGDHSFKPKSEDAALDLCCTWVESL
jgi:uncharacterized protein